MVCPQSPNEEKDHLGEDVLGRVQELEDRLQNSRQIYQL